MYKCIIIDDQTYAIETLSGYLKSCPLFNIKAVYTDPIEALMAISGGENVDCIFMDIAMPKMSGLELAGHIRNKTDRLVFCTSYRQFGYDAYEVSADAYLLKPYDLKKFLITIDQLFPPKDEDPADYFFVKEVTNSVVRKIRLSTIHAVVSEGNLIAIHLEDKIVLTRMTLTDFKKIAELKLQFIQIRRSVIIALPFITSITDNTVEMGSGLTFRLGQSFLADFKIKMNAKILDRDFN